MPLSRHTISVLLVDDHSLVRRAFRRILEDEKDLRVIGEADNGRAAVDLAHQLRPNVVVMDFALPGMTGGAATKLIVENAPELAVLIVSMHAEPVYVRVALDCGARGYLLKSAVDMELADAVRGVAAGRQVLDRRLSLPEQDDDKTRRTLTDRELEVLRLIAQGKSHREIAAELNITSATARLHRANIMQALGVHKSAKLALYAMGLGLVKGK
jgi:DNA-binding NarL/FixJ family response regulator